ncbi:tetratricopeptide repeat protein [Teredinibacter waterburyi]|uniref:tetratricopeptide repeat protein n=1 Tax=Teredinibacter waterburyi TaxID=1500538 RepID=UPI00165FABCA|nr:tetratricopeptide repeat protein [Teredinibacter waterburyi]
MNKTTLTLTYIVSIAAFVWLSGCSSSQPQTLADIDLSSDQSMQGEVFVKPKTDEEIRDAYYAYIKNASKSDRSRLTAINRLAQLELELSDKLLKDSKDSAPSAEEIEDSVYTATLRNTIELLNNALADFPDAKDNDLSLYQLARTHDQLGEHQQSLTALKRLVTKFPKSQHYAEAQFRIAESAFITGDYITAEDAYTEVLLTPTSDRFYEKSLFKRGWTRYKQQIHLEAVDDYIAALTYHQFSALTKLNKNERDLFDEYFRAIGLAFAYLDGAESLKTYFAEQQDFLYLYHTYEVISDIYLKRERYSDAAQTLVQFSEHYPNSKDIPRARLKILEIWQAGGFTENLYAAIDSFYRDYNPRASYWQQGGDTSLLKTVDTRLREYIVMVASYLHSRYQNKGKAADLAQTQLWYDRYLAHYQAYANQDDIYTLYGELLVTTGDTAAAVSYFEKAAYDGQLILDKQAAYTTIALSSQLYEKATSADGRERWLNKHLTFAKQFSELYPNDERTIEIALHAAELSFNNKRYEQALTLSNEVANNLSAAMRVKLTNIQARSHFELGNYSDAEAAYNELLKQETLSSRKVAHYSDNLAVAIYRQGEAAKANQHVDDALFHFSRISEVAPKSDIAATGLFDAVSLAMNQQQWNDAIISIKRFESLYPKHPRRIEVSRQLSVAYLKSNQNDKAADELVRLAKNDNSRDVQMAALWQAAELYERKKDWDDAIKSYRDYAHNYPTPFPQNMEAMQKLTELYGKIGNRENQHFWFVKIRSADKRAVASSKTDRTNYIAAKAVLEVARETLREFGQIKLVEPLAVNLKRKKSTMQKAIALYGQASGYGLTEVSTEATFSIGNVYQEFSIALLESERPANLSEDELEQYNILLEDQAFPFEEKAIEFYETNLGRVKQSGDSDWTSWLAQSLARLQQLFPVRFSRKGKLDAYLGETLE